MEHDQCDLPGGAFQAKQRASALWLTWFLSVFLIKYHNRGFVLFLIIKYRKGVGVTRNSLTQR